MSQDAGHPRSRRELRRSQLSQDSASPKRAYPSVPLLPPLGDTQADPEEATGVPLTGQELRARKRAVQGQHMPSAPQLKAGPEPRHSEPRHPEIQHPETQHLRRRRQAAGPTSGQTAPVKREASEGVLEAEPVTAVVDPSLRRRRIRGAEATELVIEPASVSTDQGPRPSQLRARNRAALRAYRELTPGGGSADGSEATNSVAEALPSRRLLRQQMLETERGPITNLQGAVPSIQEGASPGQAAQSSAIDRQRANRALVEPGVSQGLEREHESLLEATRAHLQNLPQQPDPLAVDLGVLTEQKKLAERAAILNQRAEVRARLASENASQEFEQSKLNDPTTAHNLAMVTPTQFIKVPGLEQPVPRPPVTSHVPIVTQRNQRVEVPSAGPLPVMTTSAAATLPKTTAAGRSPTPESPRPAQAQEAIQQSDEHLAEGEANGRARVLRRAEQAAEQRNRGASQSAGLESVPLPANSAHGLEPLDALTAGLAQAHRAKLVQWGIVAAGAVSLVVGLILTIITMTR